MDEQESRAPIYTPLGYVITQTGPRYVIGTRDGRTTTARAPEMISLGWLLDLYPSADYWHHLFPRGRGRKVNTHAAAAWFVAACRKAGPIPMPPNPVTIRRAATTAALIAAADKRYQERKATARVAHHYKKRKG